MEFVKEKLAEIIDRENLILDSQVLDRVTDYIKQGFDAEIDNLAKMYMSNEMEIDLDDFESARERGDEVKGFATYIKKNIKP